MPSDGDPTSIDEADDRDGAESNGPSGELEGPDGESNGLDRRRLLALSGTVAVGALAGCGGDGDGDGDGGGDTTTESTATTAADPTPTADPTTAPPTGTTAEPTADPTTEEPTTEPTTQETTTAAGLTDPSELLFSPSSEIQPLDGFAAQDWLVEEEPQIVKVTTLDPFGEGSLQAALETEGPRIIVFEVGGVIDLDSDSFELPSVEQTFPGVDYSKLWIAGQTAPPPGITIVRGELSPYARHSIVQHVRVRVGDEVDDAFDTMSVGSDAGNAIVDHCSLTWGVDENVSVDGGTGIGNKSLSNCIIAEGLYDSIHPKGPHSMGSLFEENQEGISILGNVYSSHEQRHPRLKGGVQAAFVNNYVYNFGVAVGMGREGDEPARASVVGNHFRSGVYTELDKAIVHGFDDGEHTSEAYLENNTVRPGQISEINTDEVEQLDERPVWPGDRLDALRAGDVEEHNFETVGARPAERTPHDERVLEDIRNNDGVRVNSQEDVGGYPDLESTERTLDVPEYGPEFAEWIRQHTRAVELGEDPPE